MLRKVIKIPPLALVLMLHGADLHAQETASPVASKLRIDSIKITGNQILSSEELKPILEPYAGKELDFLELKRIAEDITEEYRKRGYTLALK